MSHGDNSASTSFPYFQLLELGENEFLLLQSSNPWHVVIVSLIGGV